jgi:phosphate transport system substrate-binding protein
MLPGRNGQFNHSKEIPMKRSVLLLILLSVLSLPLSASAEEVTVATGSTFIDKIFNPVKSQLAASGITVKILFGDLAEVLKNLEAGNADLAGQSLGFEDWVKSAAAKGYTLKDKAALTPYIIAEEETVVIVNAVNSVGPLTKEQLQGLFSGKIQNWKEVGGKDGPVLVVWPRVSAGPTATFIKQIMGGTPITKEVLDVGSVFDTVDAVAANPEAISIINAEKVKVGSKRVTAPPIKRPLTLVTKGTPSPKVKKLLDYLQTAEAKKLFK